MFFVCVCVASEIFFCLFIVQRAEHLKEIRNLAKKAVVKRVAQRIAKYKKKLRQNLPSQVKIWDAREQRLLWDRRSSG